VLFRSLVNPGVLNDPDPYVCITGADAVVVSTQILPSVFPEVGEALLIKIRVSKEELTSIVCNDVKILLVSLVLPIIYIIYPLKSYIF
jgi:hypothetical protein